MVSTPVGCCLLVTKEHLYIDLEMRLSTPVCNNACPFLSPVTKCFPDHVYYYQSCLAFAPFVKINASSFKCVEIMWVYTTCISGGMYLEIPSRCLQVSQLALRV